ncbi:MAG: zincin-like metallopeptidase domain-containing protein [Fimbriimonadales bacterium]|nr:zincin-like metallopeptidase domain-containing protein [Fimbriimonadales bacterium]
MQHSASQDDLHQRITNQIVAAIEAGAGNYQMPWNPKLCTGPAIGLPHNPVGHYAYHGINIVALWASQQHRAYATAEWATFRQWQAAGAQVRKVEKGTLTVFFKISGSGRQSAESDEQEQRRHFIAKAAYVFNAAQVDGFIPSSPPELAPIERHAVAETFIKASKASIYHDSRQACYIPSKDEIHLPPDGAFKDAESYYSVALHELVHWSGHAGRCDRDLHNRFGSEAFAAEELIAELGAAFLCAELGISPESPLKYS